MDIKKYDKYFRSSTSPIGGVRVSVGNLYDSDERTRSMMKLQHYNDLWERLRDFRERCERNKNYTFGDQWGDEVVDHNGKSTGVSEEQNILSQGKVPLKNNLIRSLLKTILGTARNNKTEPQAISRDRDEQKLGEMMSIALQYVYQTERVFEKDVAALEQFVIKGTCFQSVRFKWDYRRQIKEVRIDNINPSRVFFNGDIQDRYGEDIRTFGILEDMTLNEVISAFATAPQDIERLKEIYRDVREDSRQTHDTFSDERLRNLQFYRPTDNNMCRVIQVWELSSDSRLRCHDKRDARMFTADLEDLDRINQINNARRKYYMENGLTAEQAEDYLISYKWFYDHFWTFTYYSPMGDVLAAGKTPFTHNDHPFAVCLYPLVDGEIHSFVEDVIDQQRYINRMITLIDFIMGASAKGVLVFPEDALGDMTKEEVLEEWVKYNGVIFAKVKAGTPMPQQISTNATNVGASELLKLELDLLKSVSGIHDALQGQTAVSGKPATLYAQESQNSATNLVDLMETFTSFRLNRDYKMMKIIQQYYDTPRYLNVAGGDYSEESKWYTPDKIRNSDFDITISQGVSTPAYRANMNNFLLSLFQMGALDAKTLLKNSAYPFADKLIKSIEQQEQAMQQQAMGQQMAALAAQGGVPSAEELGANPEAMAMISQALSA